MQKYIFHMDMGVTNHVSCMGGSNGRLPRKHLSRKKAFTKEKTPKTKEKKGTPFTKEKPKTKERKDREGRSDSSEVWVRHRSYFRTL